MDWYTVNVLLLLSPSKTFTRHRIQSGLEATTPTHLAQAEQLMQRLKSMSLQEITAFYGLKERAAEITYQHIHSWQIGGDTWPAAWSYSGETFAGFSSYSMSEEAVQYAQQNVRIISGLYGMLRPLDQIMPYRLEMQAKFEGEWSDDLYSFWRSTLRKELQSRSDTVLLLASAEMAKAVTPGLAGRRVIEPRFVKIHPDGKTTPSFPKFSRGLMAQWMCQNRITEPSQILDFSTDGYSYNEELSSEDQPVFIAPQLFTTKGRFTKSA